MVEAGCVPQTEHESEREEVGIVEVVEQGVVR